MVLTIFDRSGFGFSLLSSRCLWGLFHLVSRLFFSCLGSWWHFCCRARNFFCFFFLVLRNFLESQKFFCCIKKIGISDLIWSICCFCNLEKSTLLCTNFNVMDWLIYDTPTFWLIHTLIVWLIDWFTTRRLIDWLTRWSIGWLIDLRHADSLTDLHVNGSVDWLT